MPINWDQQDLAYWGQLRQGCPQALEALFDRYFPQLFRYGMQLIPDRRLVRVCVQDFFVALYKDHATLCEVRWVHTYLLMTFRRNLTRLPKEVYRTKGTSALLFSDPLLPSQQQLDLRKANVARNTKRMPVPTPWRHCQQEAIFLRFCEGLSYEKIAEILELHDAEYTKHLIHQAVRSLPKELFV